MKINFKNLSICLLLALGVSGCATVSRSGQDEVTPAYNASLKINSLHIKQVQEQGVLGVDAGDELTLVYSINAYDANGRLYAINNGFWGTRTHQQGAVIAAEEFDRIRVPVPEGGRVLAAFAMIEIDDYRGERSIIAAKKHTNAVRYPKASQRTTWEKDQALMPADLVSQSLAIAGYRNFATRHINVSSNDFVGGTRKELSHEELGRLLARSAPAKESYQMDGSQVNESYLYELNYGLEVARHQP